MRNILVYKYQKCGFVTNNRLELIFQKLLLWEQKE
jgi:hypothetical protein